MLDFPASPTTGQAFGQWLWDGTKWTQGNAPVATRAYDVGRNLIHNPLFAVAQRGTGPWTANGYTVDRWDISLTTDAVNFAQVALADGDRMQIGDEAATFSLRNAFTGNAAAGAFSSISHRVEKLARLAGKTVTVSFWAVATAGTPKLGINIIQFFGAGGSPSATVVALATGASATLGTTWVRYTATIAVPSIVGKTLGTNGDDHTALRFYYSSGATNNAAAGNIGVQSATILLWGIQLEIGTVATPLDYGGSYGDQLRQCQRYYQTSGYNMWGYGAAAGTFGATFVFPVQMRGMPVVSLGSPTLVNLPSLSSAADPRFVSIYGTPTATANTAFSGSYTASADL